ncbi:MaoC family dehydratase [Variovorax paradoxus]|uniref:Bifunctional enoyl-CoA hydratase/phosphate acetyltransferase n=1 Tax=Variovorax paradoxus TaxID=34073 RepID=A0A0H2LUK5_VARPD|nr:MaoC family dehydratase [Variovorax paradoxus]KLN52182.1 bifunctional enoyl-CoA hydratase/phosphate acetyltransferase [Variovorax paradoxus]
MADFEAAALAPVGPGYRFSRSHTFDEAQVRAFALAAGDENPLHHDAAFARGTRFGGLIASATHTTSLLMGLTASHFATKGKVLGMNFSVDLLRPVRASETVLIEWGVTSMAAHSKGGCVLELQGAIKSADDRTSVLAQGTVLFTPAS